LMSVLFASAAPHFASFQHNTVSNKHMPTSHSLSAEESSISCRYR
jgi:hypothetical protein